jgi:hypothetical protein
MKYEEGVDVLEIKYSELRIKRVGRMFERGDEV